MDPEIGNLHSRKQGSSGSFELMYHLCGLFKQWKPTDFERHLNLANKSFRNNGRNWQKKTSAYIVARVSAAFHNNIGHIEKLLKLDKLI